MKKVYFVYIVVTAPYLDQNTSAQIKKCAIIMCKASAKRIPSPLRSTYPKHFSTSSYLWIFFQNIYRTHRRKKCHSERSETESKNPFFLYLTVPPETRLHF